MRRQQSLRPANEIASFRSPMTIQLCFTFNARCGASLMRNPSGVVGLAIMVKWRHAHSHFAAQPRLQIAAGEVGRTARLGGEKN